MTLGSTDNTKLTLFWTVYHIQYTHIDNILTVKRPFKKGMPLHYLNELKN